MPRIQAEGADPAFNSERTRAVLDRLQAVTGVKINRPNPNHRGQVTYHEQYYHIPKQILAMAHYLQPRKYGSDEIAQVSVVMMEGIADKLEEEAKRKAEAASWQTAFEELEKYL